MDKKEKNVGWSLVPPSILSAEDINSSQKLLWGRIKGLIGKNGYCYASNKFLANSLNLNPNSISNYISILVDKGYLKRKVERNEEKEIERRKLYPLSKNNKGVSTNELIGPINNKVEGSGRVSKEIENSNSLSNPKEKYNDSAPLTNKGLDYKQIKKDFNNIVPEEREVVNITRNRKDKLQTRFEEDEFNWEKLCDKLKRSNWLLQNLNQNLFTWLIKNQENYTKVLEGSYLDSDSEESSNFNKDIVSYNPETGEYDGD